MFLSLIAVTLAVAVLVAGGVARMFDRSIANILRKIIADDLWTAWHRYVKFAIYVVGISGGVRIWDLEKYITPQGRDLILLNADRWTLEVYRTIIGTLQSIAWMLLIFFVVALLAYVVVRGREFKYRQSTAEDPKNVA